MDDIFKYNKNNREDYYKILGCDPNSSREQIIYEYKTRALLLHPDKQHNSQNTEELFKQLVKAKDVLTDPELRKAYDKWRNSGIAITFDKWNQLGKDVHISMHWINKTNRDLMVGNGCQHPKQREYNFSNERPFRSESVKKFWANDYKNEMLTKFRNYQI